MAAQLVRKCSQPFWLVATARQFTVGAALSQKVEDPVKKLFLDKMKEYKTQHKGGKLPPEDEKRLTEELDRLKRIYGEGDMSKFPTFQFKDPQTKDS